MSEKKQAAPVEVISIFTVHSVEGGTFGGVNTINKSKQPGVVMTLSEHGVLAEAKNAKVLIPYSNIKSILIK